jgi:methionyl-tRNA synthetase
MPPPQGLESMPSCTTDTYGTSMAKKAAKKGGKKKR